MEVLVPLIIRELVVYTPKKKYVINNAAYYNIVCVSNINDREPCPKYIKSKDENVYVRAKIAKCDSEGPCNPDQLPWPPEPKAMSGKWGTVDNKGAIALIVSKDEKYLVMKKFTPSILRTSWSLCKGARAYTEILRVKKETNEYYLAYGRVLEHDHVTAKEEETAEENIIREIREETGIIVPPNPGNGLESYEYQDQDTYHKFIYYYPKNAIEYKNDLETNDPDHENDEIHWVNKEKLAEMMKVDFTKGEKKLFDSRSYAFLDHYLNHRESHQQGDNESGKHDQKKAIKDAVFQIQNSIPGLYPGQSPSQCTTSLTITVGNNTYYIYHLGGNRWELILNDKRKQITKFQVVRLLEGLPADELVMLESCYTIPDDCESVAPIARGFKVKKRMDDGLVLHKIYYS
jgi:8-oxo-dGTP pyrophosphatase MutT (NUDIX family)